MKNFILFLVPVLLCISTALSQRFPALQGKTLEGKEIVLPEYAAGKYTLIGLSYNQKAEEFLRTWYDPVIDKFIIKRGMFDDLYDVNIYFIPMFTGAKKVSYEKAFKEVKRKTDPQLYKYVLFYKGNMKPYKISLGMTEKDMPYFFLLDPKGNIVATFKGRFKEVYFEQIEEILDE